MREENWLVKSHTSQEIETIKKQAEKAAKILARQVILPNRLNIRWFVALGFGLSILAFTTMNRALIPLLILVVLISIVIVTYYFRISIQCFEQEFNRLLDESYSNKIAQAVSKDQSSVVESNKSNEKNTGEYLQINNIKKV
jgi:divalent metal cation (Fe/Co/Zn/Cd) transporter